MNPSPLPDNDQIIPTKRRRLPLFIVLGSLLLVLLIVGVIIVRHSQTNNSQTNIQAPSGPYPQLYVSVDDSNTTTISNRLIVLNGRDGSVQWSHADVATGSIPSVVNANVVFRDTKNTLQILNTVDGTTRWSRPSLVYGGDHHHIYVDASNVVVSTAASPQTAMAALEIQNGHEEWRIPTTRDDHLLINDDKPYLYNTAEQYIEQLNPQTGSIVWRTNTPINYVGVLDGPFDNMLYVRDGDAFYAIDITTGQVHWNLQAVTGKAFVQTVFACGQTIVCLGYNDGAITAVNAITGKQQWHYAFNHPFPTSGSGFYAPLAIADDDTYVVIHAPQNIAVIRKSNGSLVWEKTFTNSIPISLSAPYPFGNGIIIVMALAKADTNSTTIMAFDSATGRSLWQAPGGSWNIGAPLLIRNLVVTAKQKVVTALDAKTGKVLWNEQNPTTNNQADNGIVEYLSGAFIPGD